MSPSTRRYRERKATIVDAMGGACYKCGDTRIPVLQLHHRHPTHRKVPNMHGSGASAGVLWSRRISTRTWAEVWLCDLLCANCHAVTEWA